MNRQSGDQHWTRRRPDLVRRGAEGNGAKLSAQDIEQLCAIYAKDRPKQGHLGRRFGVSRATVWRHLKAAGLVKV
jgi:hypothetical protein